MPYQTFSYYYDSLMDPQFYKDYYAFIKQQATFNSVLELGCGTGTLAIMLAKDNKEVYATDLSADMLTVARMKAQEADVNLKLACLDMRDFTTNQPVDLIICLCDSLNYLLDQNEIAKTFANVFASLNEGGTFIFDINSQYKINCILANYEEKEEDSDFFFSWQCHLKADYILSHRVEILDKITNEHLIEEQTQRCYPPELYQKQLLVAGFKNFKLYYDFNKTDHKSERIIFVVKK